MRKVELLPIRDSEPGYGPGYGYVAGYNIGPAYTLEPMFSIMYTGV